jgi:hypothetical protein
MAAFGAALIHSFGAAGVLAVRGAKDRGLSIARKAVHREKE